jgi:hypothetical protein
MRHSADFCELIAMVPFWQRIRSEWPLAPRPHGLDDGQHLPEFVPLVVEDGKPNLGPAEGSPGDVADHAADALAGCVQSGSADQKLGAGGSLVDGSMTPNPAAHDPQCTHRQYAGHQGNPHTQRHAPGTMTPSPPAALVMWMLVVIPLRWAIQLTVYLTCFSLFLFIACTIGFFALCYAYDCAISHVKFSARGRASGPPSRNQLAQIKALQLNGILAGSVAEWATKMQETTPAGVKTNCYGRRHAPGNSWNRTGHRSRRLYARS